MANSPAWTRKEGKNPEGGLNEKGRASLRAAGHDIKRPQPEGGPRKNSFCARMKGMRDKNTSSETANDPDSRINKSLRKWNCHADGGAIDIARQYRSWGGRLHAATGGGQTQELDGNQSYLQSLYQNIMGRQADEAGINFWKDQLASGNVDQGEVLQNFAGSGEFQNIYNADPAKAIAALYQTSLGRASDQPGLDFWVNQAKSGLGLSSLVGGFLGSEEGGQVSDINRLYQDYTGNVATPGQIQLAMDRANKASDFSSFINDVLPQQASDILSGVTSGISNAAGSAIDAGKTALNKAMDDLAVKDPEMRNAMAANVKVETGFQNRPEASYANTSNSRIRKIFSNTKKLSDAELNALKSDDRAFFNHVYGNKNGNQGGDDGYTYRGRGAVQLTGRDNYAKYGRMAGLGDMLVENPDLMSDPTIAARISVAYMKDMAENHKGATVFDRITRGVNAFAPTVLEKRIAYNQIPKNGEFSTYNQPVAQDNQAPGQIGADVIYNAYLSLQNAQKSAYDKWLADYTTQQTAQGNPVVNPPIGLGPQVMTAPSYQDIATKLAAIGAGGGVTGAGSFPSANMPGSVSTGYQAPTANFTPQAFGDPAVSAANQQSLRDAALSGIYGANSTVGAQWTGTPGTISGTTTVINGGPGWGAPGASVGWSGGFAPAVMFKDGGAVNVARRYRDDGGRTVLSPMERLQGYLNEKFGPREDWQDTLDQLKDSGITSVNPKGHPYTEMVNKYLTMAGIPAAGQPFTYHRLNDLPLGTGKFHQLDKTTKEYVPTNPASPSANYLISDQDDRMINQYSRHEMQGATPWRDFRNSGESYQMPTTPRRSTNAQLNGVIPASSTKFRELPIRSQAMMQSPEFKDLYGDTGVTGKSFDGATPAAHTPSDAMMPWDQTNYAQKNRISPELFKALPEREYTSQGSTSMRGHIYGGSDIDANMPDPNELRGKEKSEIQDILDQMQSKVPGKSGGGAIDIARSYRKAGGPVWDRPRPKRLGKPEKLTPGEKSSAKAAAKAAGRPYPNLVDNMRAAREDGGRLRPFMEAKIEEIGDTELGKYGIGPKAPASTRDELKAGPEQSTWEKIASKAMGDRPSPERRRFVEGAGNIADVAHLGSYATPLAPYVGAADFARGVASGDPMEVALGATGLPGRGAKAVGVAASTMMPESAEAGPLAKALNAIRAYHGSPHWFDKFDISKIGTGEGAQAYGHGLYFAENEGVARSYRDILSPYKIDNVPANEISGARAKTADDAFLASVLAHEKTPQNTRFKLDRLNRLDLMEKLDELVAQNRVTPGGHMYEVDIHADPSHMLDWDKPLTKQGRQVSEFIHPAISQYGGELPKIIGAAGNVREAVTGEQFYKALANAVSERGRDPQAATEVFREAGIPGIKYLDQGSRGAGEGTSNYVVFDPNIIEILRRYKDGGYVE